MPPKQVCIGLDLDKDDIEYDPFQLADINLSNDLKANKHNMESLNCFAHDKDVTSDVIDKMFWLMAREAKQKEIDVTIL